MTSDELMALALEMAGMTAVPAGSAISLGGVGLQRLMFGIDIGSAELLLARQLGVDGVIAHHPAGGAAVLNFPKVLNRQVELLVEAGVPVDVARGVIQPVHARALLRAQAANFDHVPSVARLLQMPFMNIHLPLDEIGRRVMRDVIAAHLATRTAEATVQDVVTALRSIPEIHDAPTNVMVPIGRLDNPAGQIVVFHGAGTNGGFPVAKALFAHDVRTVVYIHLDPGEADKIRNLGRPDVNVVVSGHIASDLIG